MRLVLFAAAFAVAACTSNPPALPTGPVNSQIVLAPGETVSVSAASISVRFESVVNDSRCPGDAVCITAGAATIRLGVLPSGGGLIYYDAHTTNVPVVRYNDLTITLENLAPYPFASRPTKPADYRATLRIRR